MTVSNTQRSLHALENLLDPVKVLRTKYAKAYEVYKSTIGDGILSTQTSINETINDPFLGLFRPSSPGL